MTTEFVSMKSAAEADQHKTSAVKAAELETMRRMFPRAGRAAGHRQQ